MQTWFQFQSDSAACLVNGKIAQGRQICLFLPDADASGEEVIPLIVRTQLQHPQSHMSFALNIANPKPKPTESPEALHLLPLLCKASPWPSRRWFPIHSLRVWLSSPSSFCRC